MTRPAVHLPEERAYVRDALFGIELLDAVTLGQVGSGVTVEAVGLRAKPIVSASGFFVWLGNDITPLQKVIIDPGVLPYERVELDAAQVPAKTLTKVELPPRADYAFAAGTTGMRGVLIEDRIGKAPVRDARVHLRWLDENSVWRDAPAPVQTGADGSFIAVLRLALGEVPLPDANGALTVRLGAQRGLTVRQSTDMPLPQGRIADPFVFAWDELQP